VPRAVFRLTFVDDKIVAIDLIVDPKRVRTSMRRCSPNTQLKPTHGDSRVGF
jgi:hypothetical protein